MKIYLQIYYNLFSTIQIYYKNIKKNKQNKILHLFFHNIYLHQNTYKIFYFILFVLIFLNKFLYIYFFFKFQIFFYFNFINI